MTKDSRIVIRMSEDLRDWVHAQASAREMDDAAYVRMVLAEARTGVRMTAIKAETPLVVVTPAPPVPRDVLDVGSDRFGTSPVIAALPEITEENAEASAQLRELAEHSPLDVDALVEQQLAEAEAAGLTDRQTDVVEQGDMPSAGVRSIRRPPPPFSPQSQPRHLAQAFA